MSNSNLQQPSCTKVAQSSFQQLHKDVGLFFRGHLVLNLHCLLIVNSVCVGVTVVLAAVEVEAVGEEMNEK